MTEQNVKEVGFQDVKGTKGRVTFCGIPMEHSMGFSRLEGNLIRYDYGKDSPIKLKHEAILTMILRNTKTEDTDHTIPCVVQSNLNDVLQLCATYISLAERDSSPIKVVGIYNLDKSYFEPDYIEVYDFKTKI